MNKTQLKNYAKLIAKKGLNIQKGQDCVIECEFDQPEFIHILTKEIYKLGARRVFVEWSSQVTQKLTYKYCSEKTLSRLESFEEEKWRWRAENLPAMCYIISEDPEGLNGINQEKMTNSKMARNRVIKPYRDKMEASYQWCIAAVPGEKWAKKVFPNDKKTVAINKLWDAILTCSRADTDPIIAWEEHNKNLKKRCEYLNSQNLTALKYLSSNGTNLTVGLNEIGIFTGGAEKTLSGVEFNPNIPSEEIFTSPKAGVCEGVVYSTKPLSYDGLIIDNFSLKFENGKVTEVKAEKNQELLEKIVKMDEGASMLGECALVPFDSPINNSQILFYETLFDENACCHLALGKGFSECIKGFENMSLKERREKGLNESMIHVDFMIGSKDLKIVGIKADGSEILIFNEGNWAF